MRGLDKETVRQALSDIGEWYAAKYLDNHWWRSEELSPRSLFKLLMCQCELSFEVCFRLILELKLLSRTEASLIAVLHLLPKLLPRWEAAHPGEYAPRKALETAKRYKAGKATLEDLEAAFEAYGEVWGKPPTNWQIPEDDWKKFTRRQMRYFVEAIERKASQASEEKRVL